jgi:transposase InsO family protein
MHRNAPLTPLGRRILVDRVLAGRPVAHVAHEMGVSRPTAYKWLRRYVSEGSEGLRDRSSRPHNSPRRCSVELEQRIIELRRERKAGPWRIGDQLGIASSTVHRVLVRHRLNRLAWLDRPTGRVIRRFERARPGELVHVDAKKLGRIPAGGGHRAHGRKVTGRNRHQRATVVGYEYVHSMVDDHSRLAYSEILPAEDGPCAAAFLERAISFFDDHQIRIERILTDNAWCYRRGNDWHLLLDEHGIGHRLIKPYRPQTNGKVERFNRTLLDEWAYASVFTNNDQRAEALTTWLKRYNYQRTHSAIGAPPATRVNNVPGRYI